MDTQMKITALISRILLGLLFLVFGLNDFLHFIPMPPPSGLAGQDVGALFLSHHLVFAFSVQVVGATLLHANGFVPLADVMRRVGYQIHVIAAVCAPCLLSGQAGTEDLKNMRVPCV
jgi:hypothetical protein